MQELTTQDIYDLRISLDRKPLNDLPDGSEFELLKYLIYNHHDVETLSLQIQLKGSVEPIVCVTSSKSFIDDFKELLEVFGDEIPTLKLVRVKSKNGRCYAKCVLK